jgi:hypothetical protein
MTSSRRRTDSPIKSVELRITFDTDRATASRIRKVLAFAVIRHGVCEVVITADHPAEVEEQAKAVLEKLRSVVEGKKTARAPEDFKKRTKGRRLKIEPA